MPRAAPPTVFVSASTCARDAAARSKSKLRTLRYATGDPAALRKRWAARAASRDPRDVSGVWRYREMLPFEEPIPFVTLFEGNTPLYRWSALRGILRAARFAAETSGMQSHRLVQGYRHDGGHHAGRGARRANRQSAPAPETRRLVLPPTPRAPACKPRCCCRAGRFPPGKLAQKPGLRRAGLRN